MTGDLDGKVMLVTGGGDEVGRECALADAREGGCIAVLDSQLDTAQPGEAYLGAPNTCWVRARTARSSRTRPHACSPPKPGS
jgi:NAD(P)-dependent dehydrogenase (short-subunit alcohol dehydrogenase family)